MESEHPEKYICPITLDLMLEPVKASDGYVYDKAAILDWYKKNNISPFTREELSPEFIKLNNLCDEITDYISKYKLKVIPYNPVIPSEEKVSDNQNNTENTESLDTDIIQFNCHNCQEELIFSKIEGRTVCSNCTKVYCMKSCINCGSENLINNSQSFMCSTCNFLNRQNTTRVRRNTIECIIS